MPFSERECEQARRSTDVLTDDCQSSAGSDVAKDEERAEYIERSVPIADPVRNTLCDAAAKADGQRATPELEATTSPSISGSVSSTSAALEAPADANDVAQALHLDNHGDQACEEHGSTHAQADDARDVNSAAEDNAVSWEDVRPAADAQRNAGGSLANTADSTSESNESVPPEPTPSQSPMKSGERSRPQLHHIAEQRCNSLADAGNSAQAEAAATKSEAEEALHDRHATTAPQDESVREKLAERATEVLHLRGEVRRLAQSRAWGEHAVAQSGERVSIAKGELEALRKDLAEQEALLAAYDDANRNAMHRVKVLETTLKEKDASMEEERRALERDVVRALEGQQQNSVDTAAKLRRVLQLESQLAATEEEATAREAELRDMVEVLRREKKDLEARAAGVNLEAMQQGDALVAQVREEMQAMRSQYEQQLALLHDKLKWYAANQELLTENEALLKDQAQLIAELKAQLQAAPPPGEQASTHRRVAELTEQVKELKEALAGDKRGMLATLVREAAAPSTAQAEELMQLRAELARERRRADEVAETAQRQTRALLQQHEKLKADLGARAAAGERRGAPRRVQELEAQLEDVRVHYQRKVRSLQMQLEAGSSGVASPARSASQSHSHSGAHSRPGERASAVLEERTNNLSEGGGVRTSQSLTKQWVHLRQQVAELKQAVSAKDATIQELRAQQGPFPTAPQQPPAQPPPQLHESETANQLHTQVQQLGQRLAQTQAVQAELQGHVASANERREQAERELAAARREAGGQSSELRAEVVQLTARLEAAHAMVTSLSAAHDSATAALAETRQQHAAEIARLSRSQDALVAAAAREATAMEAEHHRERLAAVQAEHAAAARRAADLEAELREVRRSKVWAPSAREMAALEQQVQSMAAQLSGQQQQWQGFLSAAQAQPLFGGSSATLRSDSAMQPPARFSQGASSGLASGAQGQSSAYDTSRAWYGAGADLGVDAGAVSDAVRAKLQFLQSEVEKVITSAASMQQSRAQGV